VYLWVDLAAPSIPEFLILSDTFRFHPLSVEDARADIHSPKIEAYDGYLYAILHGIDFKPGQPGFATHDVDFFIGPHYLVTVHDGRSRSIAELQENVARNAKILGEGPVSLFHRIVDSMVDHYRPEVNKLEDRFESSLWVMNADGSRNRFLTTGDPAAFAEMGKRFLQLPIREVESVTLRLPESAAA